MKKIGIFALLLSGVCLTFFSCYYSSCAWSEAAQKITFTLDKYEAAAGDEITVNTGDIKVFNEDDVSLQFCCESEDGVVKYFHRCEVIRKINSKNAVFKIPDDIFDIPDSVQNEYDFTVEQLKDGFEPELTLLFKIPRTNPCTGEVDDNSDNAYYNGSCEKKLKVKRKS